MKPTDANDLIKPEHIDTGEHFWNAFGKCEKEITARWVVRFCQQRGDWGPFHETELTKFYHEGMEREESFHWNGLGDNGIEFADGMVFIQHEFVTACFKASPKKD